ncbi:alpha-L-fucosidase [Paenibacillus harenae]|uniref:alpha-L-fucosidase n=1 Tax=Paenibacillus harenae TaxID=306543 RepID=A0ABT9UAY3_PAEHA|nr:alpha-L-fucosidase [Paenibacillus harenae]
MDDPLFASGLQAVAHLYNTSAAANGGVNRAIFNQKDRRQEVYRNGILDIERSQSPDIRPEPWQTDTCVGEWFYNVNTVYKKPGHVIEILVDIIAKNGNMLLNIPQKPDGTIDNEYTYILQEMAKWIRVYGEGVYGNRPFRVSGEGPSRVVIDHFKEDRVECSSDDFRFTQKGNTLYAFQMQWPKDHRAVIRTLTPADKVESVRLLGVDQLLTPYVNCLAIELKP